MRLQRPSPARGARRATRETAERRARPAPPSAPPPYLDGAPVPGTNRPLAAGAGAHALEVRANCPNGDISLQGASPFPDWTVLLLG